MNEQANSNAEVNTATPCRACPAAAQDAQSLADANAGKAGFSECAECGFVHTRCTPIEASAAPPAERQPDGWILREAWDSREIYASFAIYTASAFEGEPSENYRPVFLSGTPPPSPAEPGPVLLHLDAARDMWKARCLESDAKASRLEAEIAAKALAPVASIECVLCSRQICTAPSAPETATICYPCHAEAVAALKESLHLLQDGPVAMCPECWLAINADDVGDSVTCDACGQTFAAKPDAKPDAEPEAPEPPEGFGLLADDEIIVFGDLVAYDSEAFVDACGSIGDRVNTDSARIAIRPIEPEPESPTWNCGCTSGLPASLSRCPRCKDERPTPKAPAAPVMDGYAAVALTQEDECLWIDDPRNRLNIPLGELEPLRVGGLAFLLPNGEWQIHCDGAPLKFSDGSGLHLTYYPGDVVVRPAFVMLAAADAAQGEG